MMPKQPGVSSKYQKNFYNVSNLHSYHWSINLFNDRYGSEKPNYAHLHNYFKFDVRLYFRRVACVACVSSPRPPGGASVPAKQGP